MLIAVAYPSNPIIALIVAVLIVVATRPIIRRVAILEGHPWLVGVMTVSLILHLMAAPAQIFVVDHFYHGVADWLRYDNQGAGLSGSFRHFDFTLANGHLRGIVNDGSVSIAAGMVFTLVGTNPLAAFLVFSWLAFLIGILFGILGVVFLLQLILPVWVTAIAGIQAFWWLGSSIMILIRTEKKLK